LEIKGIRNEGNMKNKRKRRRKSKEDQGTIGTKRMKINKNKE